MSSNAALEFVAGRARSVALRAVLVTAAVFGLIVPGVARAQPLVSNSWLAEVSDDWFNPARWSLGVAPDNNVTNRYDVFIGQGLPGPTPYTVSLDANATIESLEVTQAFSFLDLTTNTLTCNADLVVTDASILGSLGGNSRLSVAGSISLTRAFFMWTTLETGAGSTLTFGGVGGDSTIICDTDVNHRGYATLDSEEELVVMGGSRITVEIGGTFDLQSALGTITGQPGGGGSPEILNRGTFLQDTPGASTTITGLDFMNEGLVDLSAGTLSTDGVPLVGGRLDTGTWRLSGGSTLDLQGAAIMTNGATVEIDGASTTFAALAGLAANDAAGTLRFSGGADFTTAADFTNDGTLAVGDATEFTIVSGSALTNFATGTLTGGTFDIAGTLRFDGADVTDLNAAITLDGPTAQIVDQIGQDGLRNLDTIAPSGDLTLRAGSTFTTAGDLTVAATGRLGVDIGSTFTVPAGSTVTNFAGGTFSGGVFDIRGTLVLDADVETLDGDFTLDGPVSTIIRPGGGDIFENLSLIDTNGALTLRNGRSLAVLGNVTVNGRLTVESGPPEDPSILTVPNDLVQISGVTELREGGVIRVGAGGSGAFRLSGGVLTGVGTIDGDLIQTGGSVRPGNSPGTLVIDGNWSLDPLASVSIELAGTGPGLADFIEAAGAVEFGTPSSPTAGTLLILLTNGYVPSPAGDTFEIIRGSQRFGQFALVQGPMVGGNAAFEVLYSPTSVWVTVYAVPSPAGLLLLAITPIAVGGRRRSA